MRNTESRFKDSIKLLLLLFVIKLFYDNRDALSKLNEATSIVVDMKYTTTQSASATTTDDGVEGIGGVGGVGMIMSPPPGHDNIRLRISSNPRDEGNAFN